MGELAADFAPAHPSGDESNGGQQPREVVTRVRDYMKANKLSQCQISQATQISQAVISQWREIISIQTSILVLCERLNISLILLDLCFLSVRTPNERTIVAGYDTSTY